MAKKFKLQTGVDEKVEYKTIVVEVEEEVTETRKILRSLEQVDVMVENIDLQISMMNDQKDILKADRAKIAKEADKVKNAINKE